jgi:hypothetical protein
MRMGRRSEFTPAQKRDAVLTVPTKRKTVSEVCRELKGTWQVNVNSTTRARIETGGGGVVTHVGLRALGRFADQPLGAGLSARIPPAGERFPFA